MKLVITSYTSITHNLYKNITMNPGRYHHLQYMTRNTETNIIMMGQKKNNITCIIMILTVNTNMDP
jgi:hypothetical protein